MYRKSGAVAIATSLAKHHRKHFFSSPTVQDCTHIGNRNFPFPHPPVSGVLSKTTFASHNEGAKEGGKKPSQGKERREEMLVNENVNTLKLEYVL